MACWASSCSRLLASCSANGSAAPFCCFSAAFLARASDSYRSSSSSPASKMNTELASKWQTFCAMTTCLKDVANFQEKYLSNNSVTITTTDQTVNVLIMHYMLLTRLYRVHFACVCPASSTNSECFALTYHLIICFPHCQGSIVGLLQRIVIPADMNTAVGRESHRRRYNLQQMPAMSVNIFRVEPFSMSLTKMQLARPDHGHNAFHEAVPHQGCWTVAFRHSCKGSTEQASQESRNVLTQSHDNSRKGWSADA